MQASEEQASEEFVYRLAPGVDVVPLGNGDVLLRSEEVALRLEGPAARELAQSTLPALIRWCRFDEIAVRSPAFSRDDLRQHLASLVSADVLMRLPLSALPSDAQSSGTPTQLFLECFGFTPQEISDRLQNLKVAVFGLQGHGSYVATALAQCGVGSLLLVDPWACQAGDLVLSQFLSPQHLGISRQAALCDLLQRSHEQCELATAGDKPLSRARVAELSSGRDLLICCFDKGFSTARHWLNRASLSLNIPALYAEVCGHTGYVGPLVLPERTPCFMCYRMRRLACEPDYEASMRYEEHLDQLKVPAMHERPVLPGLAMAVGGLAAAECFKILLSLNQCGVAGAVTEIDLMGLRMQTHPILRHSDCCVCAKKKVRNLPALTNMANEPRGSLLVAADRLISQRTGIVRDTRLVEKDVSEPQVPYVVRTELANHRFVSGDRTETRICSGKGLTLATAKTSALGEAIERYSAACWTRDEVRYARRSELPEASLDPRRLVLYAPDQYPQLKYAPYGDETILGWVRGHSLTRCEEILLPALSVFMNYEVQADEEFLFPTTSNGLAAGETLAEAVLAAALEVVERDAMMLAWLHRMDCQAIEPWSHPDADIVNVCKAYLRRGVEMRLFRLPTDHGCHVFLAMGIDRGTGPFAVAGMGAALDPTYAARKAILEVCQIRPSLRQRMRRPESQHRMSELVEDPRRVANLEDHDLLYASAKREASLDFLLERPTTIFNWSTPPPMPATEKLRQLTASIRAAGSDVIYCNLTAPEMQDLNLYTARVIIPDFQPIDFGWSERRLGGQRLYEFPLQLGLVDGRATPATLNPDPHPIS